MKLFASVATTADGYLDDASDRRLIISSPEDLREVQRLRAEYDAILVGAETVRRDDPSLTLRDAEARARRIARGLPPEPAKVTLTVSGDLDPRARFFTEASGRKIVLSARPLPALESVAAVIRPDGPITPSVLITELEKQGIERLFVEGGARMLRWLFAADAVDTLRLAVNPALRLDHPCGAPRLDIGTAYRTAPHTEARFGATHVVTYALRPDREAEDRRMLRRAIDASRRCTPSATSYCVGAVVRTAAGDCFEGHTHETSPTRHAEQEAIAKAAAAGADLRGATIWCSMEPCSQRSSEPESCTELILRCGVARVVFACYEPDRFVRCCGAQRLRDRGVDVCAYPTMAAEVLRINGHLFR